jgi:hypothetical protein
MEKKGTKVKKENFICIQGWMISEMRLKGNDLLVYAIIYGFSQDGSSYFSGGLQYLADWVNGTKRGVQKNLDNLLEKGLITRIQTETGKGIPSVQFAICLQALPWNAELKTEEKVECVESSSTAVLEKKEDENEEQSSMGYRTEFHGGIEQSSMGIEQSSMGYRTEFHGGIELSSTNNKYNNINYNKASNEAEEMTRADQIGAIEQRWNRLAQEIGLRKICKLISSSKRYGAVNARISQYGYEEVCSAVDSIRKSTFLQGNNDRGWRIDFDWLFKPNNFPKVLEGKYADNKGAVNHDGYSNGSGSVNRADQPAQGRKYNPADFFGDAWRA